MADLSNILGGPWSPPSQKHVDAPDIQLKDAMLAAGLKPPDTIHLDGKLHRFNSGTKGEKGTTSLVGTLPLVMAYQLVALAAGVLALNPVGKQTLAAV